MRIRSGKSVIVHTKTKTKKESVTKADASIVRFVGKKLDYNLNVSISLGSYSYGTKKAIRKALAESAALREHCADMATLVYNRLVECNIFGKDLGCMRLDKKFCTNTKCGMCTAEQHRVATLCRSLVFPEYRYGERALTESKVLNGKKILITHIPVQDVAKAITSGPLYRYYAHEALLASRREETSVYNFVSKCKEALKKTYFQEKLNSLEVKVLYSEQPSQTPSLKRGVSGKLLVATIRLPSFVLVPPATEENASRVDIDNVDEPLCVFELTD